MIRKRWWQLQPPRMASSGDSFVASRVYRTGACLWMWAMHSGYDYFVAFDAVCDGSSCSDQLLMQVLVRGVPSAVFCYGWLRRNTVSSSVPVFYMCSLEKKIWPSSLSRIFVYFPLTCWTTKWDIEEEGLQIAGMTSLKHTSPIKARTARATGGDLLIQKVSTLWNLMARWSDYSLDIDVLHCHASNAPHRCSTIAVFDLCKYCVHKWHIDNRWRPPT